MPRKRHSKKSIVHMLQNLAKRLGKDTLTQQDIRSGLGGDLPLSSMRNHFGSLGKALEAAGLKVIPGYSHLVDARKTLTDDELFADLQDVERRLGKEPRYNDYNAEGGYSVTTFKKRFGKWPDVLKHYRKWKADNPSGTPEAQPSASGAKDATSAATTVRDADIRSPAGTARPKRPPQLFGEPIDFRGLRHAPINEQAVIYLFGMISRELGFSIEALQQGFPDCEGKYLHDAKKKLWAKARIEFEFKASNFHEHGHDAEQCDFIVCWENDWPDCPLTVIELRKEILKLPAT